MKKISIFLASSDLDLKTDKAEIGNFIRRLNEIYINYDIYFSSYTPKEGGDPAEAIAALRDCESCFFLLFRTIGQETSDEFDAALDAFRGNGTPKIFTYLKYVQTPEEAEEGIKAFLRRLGNELGHYYNTYRDIDTLKLGILMQILLEHPNAAAPRLENGKILFGQQEIAEIDRIPLFTGNPRLQEMQREVAELNRQYCALQEQQIAAPEDEALFRAFCDVASRKAKAEEDLRAAEKEALSLATELYREMAKRELSERQKTAYRALERGDYAAAEAILNWRELLEDRDRAKARTDEMLRTADALAAAAIASTQTNIDERLLRIRLLKNRGMDAGIVAEIRTIYASVDEDIQAYQARGINPAPLYDYATFLWEQKDFSAAEAVALRLKGYYAASKDVSEADEAALYHLLGTLYSNTNRFAEAEEFFLRALDLYERLAEKQPDAFAPDLAMSCNNLGNLYQDTKRFEKAETFHLRALEIRERLAEKQPDAFAPDLAMSCCNLGTLYSDTNRYDKAETFFQRAVDLYERLAEKNPGVYASKLEKSRSLLLNSRFGGDIE